MILKTPSRFIFKRLENIPAVKTFLALVSVKRPVPTFPDNGYRFPNLVTDPCFKINLRVLLTLDFYGYIVKSWINFCG
jgi:hypothetical protein